MNELMVKAKRAADSARLLLKSGDLDGACNRSYYAMFDASKAALFFSDSSFMQEDIRTHGGLISAFSLRLVKPGHIPIELGRSLNKVEELRLIADYRGDSVSMEKAEWAVHQADLFVEFIEQYLSSHDF